MGKEAIRTLESEKKICQFQKPTRNLGSSRGDNLSIVRQ